MPEPMRLENVPDELLDIAVETVDGTGAIAWELDMQHVLAAVLPAHEAMVLARIKALADDEPEPEEADEDSCRLVDIDGETVRVRGSGDMDEQDQQALGSLFRAARARMKAEKDAERAEIERQVRAKVAEELRADAAVYRTIAERRSDGGPTFLASARTVEAAAKRITRDPHATGLITDAERGEP